MRQYDKVNCRLIALATSMATQTIGLAFTILLVMVRFLLEVD